MEIAALLLLSLTILMVVVSPLGRLSPAAILAGAWGVVYALQSIFASDMVSSFVATISIFSITLAFAAGEIIGCRGLTLQSTVIVSNTAAISEESKFAKKFKKIVIFFGVLSIAGAMQYAYALKLFEASSFADLIILPGVAREQIFAGELDVPFVSRLGFLLSYSGVILALSYYYFFKWHWYLALSMVAVLLLGMSQSGRAGILVVLLQVIIVTYFKNVLIFRKKASWFFLRKLLSPILLMFSIFFGGQFLREGFGAIDSEDLIRVLHSLRGYLFGGVSAYSSWIQDSYNMDSISFGRYSFSSLFAALGIYAQAPGIYDEYLSISSSGETSNVFTAYRSFIDDFSIVGACVFYFIAGITVGSIAFNFIRGKVNLILILIPVISWLAFSPLASLTYFNSFLLSCLLPFVLVRRLIKTS